MFGTQSTELGGVQFARAKVTFHSSLRAGEPSLATRASLLLDLGNTVAQ